MVIAGAHTTVAVDAMRAYVAKLRRELGISQQAVAEALGIRRQTWVEYETGQTKEMRLGVWIAAFRYLKGSFDDLREVAGESTTPATAEQLATLRALTLRGEKRLEALRATLSKEEFEAWARAEISRLRSELDALDSA